MKAQMCRWLCVVTWLDGVLVRCRVLRGWGRTSGVLLVLLADEPDIEACTEAITLACSGGTYLKMTVAQ